MILTRRFGGLRMHGVVTPPSEESKVRELGQTDQADQVEQNHQTTVERDDDRQRAAA